MGELRVAGPDDELRVGVDIQLFLERLADVDLGEDTEALLLQCGLGGGDGGVEVEVEVDARVKPMVFSLVGYQMPAAARPPV